MMGSIVVDFKGNEVGVGTGFTDEQRRAMWEQRDSLPGTLAEVKYKEISANKKTGAESLQFPVFVQLRDDKSEVSYG
jgi:DNA ligase-1